MDPPVLFDGLITFLFIHRTFRFEMEIEGYKFDSWHFSHASISFLLLITFFSNEVFEQVQMRRMSLVK